MQQAQQHSSSTLIATYIAHGGVITQCKTKRARGIAYFALTLKGSKHRGKINYMRNKRAA